MKKFFSLFLTGIMVLTLSVPAFASEPSRNISPNIEIKEYVDSENRVIRTYNKETNAVASRSASAPIEDVLSALGMEDTAIDGLSNDEVESFNESTSITSVTSYIKVDKDGNMFYLSEEEALRELSELRASGFSQDTYEDDYMRVWHALSYLGNANYQVTTDARWLKMPNFRGTDAVGASVQYLTVTPSSMTGYYSYDYVKVAGTGTSSGFSGNITIRDFGTASDGNFYGCAAYIDLPDDYSTGTTSHKYSDFFVHMSYKGHMNYPTVPCWFNSTGTYVHVYRSVSFDPTLSIDSSGLAGVISLGLKKSEEPRSAELEVYYTP